MPATDDAPAVEPIARDIQPVDRAADMVAFADHLAAVAMAHRSRELERLAVPAMTAADYAEPIGQLPDGRPIVRSIPDQAYKGTGHLPFDRPADRESRAALAAAFSARLAGAPEPDTYVAAVAKRAHKASAPVAVVQPEPIQAPDPMTICNGCDAAPALSDSPAGYCSDCERAAVVEPEPNAHEAAVAVEYAESDGAPILSAADTDEAYSAARAAEEWAATIAPEPTNWHCADCDADYPLPVVSHAVYHVAEPVSIAPAPVLAVVPSTMPDGRPTCERCGQVFRKHGTGAEWHRMNRPDCAGAAGRPSIAS